MNKLFRKFCGSVNYKTYNMIKDGIFTSAYFTSMANVIINYDNMELLQVINSFPSFLYILSIYLYFSNGQYYSKDIMEIKNLYQEFIHNYNKINKDFNLNEPISIYTVFNYLIYNGYLSKNKKYEFSSKGCMNMPNFMGIDVITGTGVCRHISSMLTDILNDYEINACNVCCYASKDYLDIVSVSPKRYSREKNIKLIEKYAISKYEKDHLITVNDFFRKNGTPVKIKLVHQKEKDLRKKIVGNHLITYSLHNGKSYYMDPTNARIYRLKENEKGVIYDDNNRLKVKNLGFCMINDRDNTESYKLKKDILINHDSISLEEEKEIITSTLNICDKNQDIFEKFYNDNHELYSEISDRLLKVRKR